MVDTASFYISGGTLGPDAQSYIERDADTRLFDGLVAGEFCYVLDARQMGKSSLMARTAGKLRGSGSKVVILDLSELGQNLSVEQWYYGLLIRLGEQLDIEMELLKYWKDNSQIGPLQRWMSGLRKVALEILDENIVIFVDEIDVVRSLPFSTDEFFAGIRECYNRRTEDSELARLSFCLIGVATPADLIRDVRTTPFNIGRRIELADFTDTEAAPLAKGLSSGGRDGDKLLKRILYWTGGHPYLTQRLCQAVSESADVTNAGGVDRICEALFLTKFAREADDNLAFVRNRILRGEADLAALLDLYHQVRSRKRRIRDDDANPLLDLLRLSGVVRVVEGYLWVRNRIYFRVFDRQWVLMNMPDAELRRQKAAYRAGVLRAAGVATAIILLMAWLATSRQSALSKMSAALVDATKARQSEKAMRLVAENETKKKEQALSVANKEKNRAQIAEAKAKEALVKEKQSREQALVFAYKEKQQRTIAEQRAFSEARLRYISDMRLAQECWDSNPPNPERTTELLENHLPGHGDPADFRGFEWAYLWNQSHKMLLLLKGGHASYSPDGKRVLTICDDNTARIWDAISGMELTRLKGHKDSVWSAYFSPDGKRVVTSGEDNTARVWDSSTGKELVRLIGQTDNVKLAFFSPNGKRIAAIADDYTARIWDSETGKDLVSLHELSRIGKICFSPDSKQVFTADEGGSIGIWDAMAGVPLPSIKGSRATEGPVFYGSISFSPDGKRIAMSNDNKTIRIMDASTRKELLSISMPINPYCTPAFSPNNRLIVSAGVENDGAIWDAVTGNHVAWLNGHSSPISFVAFSPDSKRVLTHDRDDVVRVWDAETGSELASFRGVAATSFSPDGKRILTSDYNTSRIWDACTGKECVPYKEMPSSNMACVSPNGASIIINSHDNLVHIWDLASGKERFSLKGYTAAFSPDGKRIVTTGGDTTAHIWDFASGKELVSLKGNDTHMSSPSFSPDGTRVLTEGQVYDRRVGADTRAATGKVQMWNATTGKELFSFKGYTNAFFSPDSKRVLTEGKDVARMWDAVTGRELLSLNGVISACFSPDGKRVAATDIDGTVHMRDVFTGKEIVILKGHKGLVRSTSFSPDGKRIVILGEDGTARIWDACKGKELIAIKGYAGYDSLSFSPDGKRILTASDNFAKIWDATTGRELTSLKGHSSYIAWASFISDGKRVVTVGSDNTIRIWNGDVAAIDRRLAAEKKSNRAHK